MKLPLSDPTRELLIEEDRIGVTVTGECETELVEAMVGVGEGITVSDTETFVSDEVMVRDAVNEVDLDGSSVTEPVCDADNVTSDENESVDDCVTLRCDDSESVFVWLRSEEMDSGVFERLGVSDAVRELVLLCEITLDAVVVGDSVKAVRVSWLVWDMLRVGSLVAEVVADRDCDSEPEGIADGVCDGVAKERVLDLDEDMSCVVDSEICRVFELVAVAE